MAKDTYFRIPPPTCQKQNYKEKFVLKYNIYSIFW